MNITLSLSSVGKVFSSLSGENAEQYEGLLLAAAKSVCAMLIKGDHRSRESELIHAAACLAYYRYVLLAVGEGTTSYKAGDITVNSDLESARQSARALLDDAFGAIRGIIKSSGFCFKSI